MNKKPNIFIFSSAEDKNLQDDLVSLAEGFRELGITYYSNNNYWKELPGNEEFLIKKNENISPWDCDVIIFPYTWYYWIKEGEGIFEKQIDKRLDYFKGIKICIDCHDGYSTFSFKNEFRIFDYVLRSHFNKNCYHPSNHVPWNLGITNRIIECTRSSYSFEEKKKDILWNFGASHPYRHQLRMLMEKKAKPLFAKQLTVNSDLDNLDVEPQDHYHKLMWVQCVRRHNEAYYNRLKSHQLCASFCGQLIPNKPFNPSLYLKGGNKAKLLLSSYQMLSHLTFSKPRLIQWDSWRFWESLCAGCVPIHIDLEKYGVKLPIMPKNWEHYIGIDLNNIKQDIERIIEDEATLKLIAEKGREWAIANYAPKESAKRLLNLIGYNL